MSDRDFSRHVLHAEFGKIAVRWTASQLCVTVVAIVRHSGRNCASRWLTDERLMLGLEAMHTGPISRCA
jgi:hypothetical protein